MGQFSGFSVVLVCSFALAGCANNTPQQEQAGLVIGGVLGGVLGSQIGQGDGRTTAIILGTLAGAAIGGSIGHTMGEVDRINLSEAAAERVKALFEFEPHGAIETKAGARIAMQTLLRIRPELSADVDGITPNDRFRALAAV